MAFPQNEEQTIQLYRLIQNRIGWRIVESQTNAFPDAILESDDGERLACEFEHLSKNFKKHRHPVDDSCDLIICWRDNWPKSPLPVMALEDCAKEEAMNLHCLLSRYIPKQDLSSLYFQIEMLQREVKRKDGEISRLDNIDRWFYKISADAACVVMACGFFLWGLYRLLEWLLRFFEEGEQ